MQAFEVASESKGGAYGIGRAEATNSARSPFSSTGMILDLMEFCNVVDDEQVDYAAVIADMAAKRDALTASNSEIQTLPVPPGGYW